MHLKVRSVDGRLTVVIDDSKTKEGNGKCELFFFMLYRAVVVRQIVSLLQDNGCLPEFVALRDPECLHSSVSQDIEINLAVGPYIMSMRRDQTSLATEHETRVRYLYMITLEDKREVPDTQEMEDIFTMARELTNISKRRVVRGTQPIRELFTDSDGGAW